MDKFNVICPHFTALFLILLYIAFNGIWVIISGIITIVIFNWKRAGKIEWPNYVWRMSKQMWEQIIFFIISVLAFVIIVFYIVPALYSKSFHIPASVNWDKEAKQTEVVLIFGFGYGKDNNGNMTPEKSNQFLYDLAIQQTKVKYLILQQGVYLAAIKDSSLHSHNIVSIQMHPLIPKKDVNTFEASRYAIMKMDSLQKTKAIVYACNIQLKRVVADLRKIARQNPKWKNFTFIVPPIQTTPFPEHSAQKRTRYKVIYKAIELYYSRIRDMWYY